MDRPLMPTGWRGRSHRLVRGMVPAAFVGTILSFAGLTFTGCAYSPTMRATVAPYQHSSCCCVNEIRARIKAKSIWREKYAHCYGNRANAHDIKAGFIDGYVETMGGGSGCPPMIAPQRYSGLACLTHGKPSPGAWFEGYPLGAAVAESCGAHHRGQSPLNPALLACFKEDSCNPGCCPCEPASCGCGQSSCGGGCGCNATTGLESPIQGSHVHAIQSGMKDDDGAVIIEHSTAPVPVPTSDLPVPAAAPEGNTPPLPVPSDVTASQPDQAPDVNPFGTNEVASQAEAVIDGPVEMPNMQVRFDMDETQWLFGDVDIAQSLLQTSIDNNQAATSALP